MSDAIASLIRMERAFLFARELPFGSNRGQVVEQFLKFVGLDAGNPWCCAYQVYSVHHAHPGIEVPKTGGCAVMAEWAVKNNLTRNDLAVGDWVLIWHPTMGRVGHIVLVVEVKENGAYVCIEGNAADPSKPATREGNGAYEGRIRHLGEHDVIVRWADLPSITAKAA